MKFGLCKDCKHWQEVKRLSQWIGVPRIPQPYMVCIEADVDTPNGWDDAHLRCEPEFGCTKWEALV